MENVSPSIPNSRRMAALVAHVGGFLFMTFTAAVLVPWLMWVYFKGESDEFVADHALESLDFTLSVGLYLAIAFVATYVAGIFSVFVFSFGFSADGELTKLIPSATTLFFYFFVALIALFELICVYRAARAAHLGKPFRYPASLRVVRRYFSNW